MSNHISNAQLHYTTMSTGQCVFVVRNQEYDLRDVEIVCNLLNDFAFKGRGYRFEYYGKKSVGHTIGVYVE